uniref:Uncharacterized protein n=1 Tax=Panagrellus redivivus TaxID=6233 RepID=A0A7E4USM8_PANRE
MVIEIGAFEHLEIKPMSTNFHMSQTPNACNFPETASVLRIGSICRQHITLKVAVEPQHREDRSTAQRFQLISKPRPFVDKTYLLDGPKHASLSILSDIWLVITMFIVVNVPSLPQFLRMPT